MRLARWSISSWNNEGAQFTVYVHIRLYHQFSYKLFKSFDYILPETEQEPSRCSSGTRVKITGSKVPSFNVIPRTFDAFDASPSRSSPSVASYGAFYHLASSSCQWPDFSLFNPASIQFRNLLELEGVDSQLWRRRMAVKPR